MRRSYPRPTAAQGGQRRHSIFHPQTNQSLAVNRRMQDCQRGGACNDATTVPAGYGADGVGSNGRWASSERGLQIRHPSCLHFWHLLCLCTVESFTSRVATQKEVCAYTAPLFFFFFFFWHCPRCPVSHAKERVTRMCWKKPRKCACARFKTSSSKQRSIVVLSIRVEKCREVSQPNFGWFIVRTKGLPGRHFADDLSASLTLRNGRSTHLGRVMKTWGLFHYFAHEDRYFESNSGPLPSSGARI